jgi:ribosome-binding ATPase YchF (GTP1/OBG family)
MSSAPERRKIALTGNPNSGKSSLFNHLTGLNQKIGNFPGVTVEKKSGMCALPDRSIVEVIDFPAFTPEALMNALFRRFSLITILLQRRIKLLSSLMQQT